MTHQYNTRTNKGDFQDALPSIEQNISNSINSIKTDINSIKGDISSVKTNLKHEINNLKDVIIKRLQEENATLRERCSKLEQRIKLFPDFDFDDEPFHDVYVMSWIWLL